MFTPEQSKRYSRHFILREVGIMGQEKLMSSSVLVIGAGGLGSSVIMHLAAAGVGRLGIADFDVVEQSNLNRQVIHSTLSLGKGKAESASEFVARLNPDVKVDVIAERLTAENITPVIEKYDFTVDCTDRFETKFLINDACVLANKPFCHGGVAGLEGQIFTYVPFSPCLRCVLGEIPFDAPTCSDFGVLGASVGVIGSMQALEAIKFLVGQGELLTGRLLKFDGRNMRTATIKIGRDPDCPVCGKKTLTELKAENYLPKGGCQ